MNIKKDFPEFESIEARICRANAERSVYVGSAIAEGLIATGRFVRQVARFIGGAFPHGNAEGTTMLKRFAAHR